MNIEQKLKEYELKLEDFNPDQMQQIRLDLEKEKQEDYEPNI